MSHDAQEAWANALIGLAVSVAAVWILRRAGLWSAAPAWAISGMFFALSWLRSRVLRAVFRGMDG